MTLNCTDSTTRECVFIVEINQNTFIKCERVIAARIELTFDRRSTKFKLRSHGIPGHFGQPKNY